MVFIRLTILDNRTKYKDAELMVVTFFKVVNFVRGGHCDYWHRAPNLWGGGGINGEVTAHEACG